MMALFDDALLPHCTTSNRKSNLSYDTFILLHHIESQQSNSRNKASTLKVRYTSIQVKQSQVLHNGLIVKALKGVSLPQLYSNQSCLAAAKGTAMLLHPRPEHYVADLHILGFEQAVTKELETAVTAQRHNRNCFAYQALRNNIVNIV